MATELLVHGGERVSLQLAHIQSQHTAGCDNNGGLGRRMRLGGDHVASGAHMDDGKASATLINLIHPHGLQVLS